MGLTDNKSNTESGDGLVLPGNVSLPEPKLTKFNDAL